MKRAWLIAVVFIGVMAAVAAFLIRVPVPPVPISVANPEGLPSPQELVTGLSSSTSTAAEPETSATSQPQAPREEQAETPSIGYLPPPNRNLSGSTLGRQRVPLPDAIADIHQISYHTPTLTLFMAVSETDGRQSIWRLPENGRAERVFSAEDKNGQLSIFTDSKGVIYVQSDNPNRLYRSADGLKTWYLVLKDYGTFWNIADDGKGNVYGTTHDWNRAVLYRSPNDGFNWEPFVDFQRLFPQYAQTYREGDDRFLLRHLHDVIYDQHKQQLIVGTGDVARFAFMSPDEGKTWKKVWDEGFTSAIPMSGGFRWLLGPDQLHAHGLAIYDAASGTTREVWSPIPYTYAGYIYSLLNVNGIYYAAIHTEANEVDDIVPKFGIIASPDGEAWYPFLEYGPLTSHARTNVWLAQAPTYVYASVNGVLYAFRPLDQDWFRGKTPFASTPLP